MKNRFCIFAINTKIEKDVNKTKNTIVDTVNNSKDAIIAEFQKNQSREKTEIELKFVKSSMDDTKLCLNAKDIKQCIKSVVKKYEGNQQIFNNSQNSVDTLNKK